MHTAQAAASACPVQTPAAVPFEITAVGGQRVATNGVLSLVLDGPDGPDTGRLFRRRAVRGFGTPEAQHVEWAVAELDGVRVYVDGSTVIVTRRDLNP